MAAKLAKEKKKIESAGKEIATSLLEYLCVLWAVILAFALPLYMKQGYYQIGTAKYTAYKYMVIFLIPLLLLVVVVYLVSAHKERKLNGEPVQKIREAISLTDWFVLAYILSAFLSFLLSGTYKEAFWGYSGWFMGLFSQLSFVLIYFILSRFMKDYQVALGALLPVTFYVFIIGILHRLLMDPLGVYADISDYYKTQFLSTLGQASWYSSFITTVIPVAMFAYWYLKVIWQKVLAGIFLFVGFMTLVTQNTDSAYFGFAAAMLVIFHVSVKEAGRMRKLCEIALLFLLAPKAMALLLKIHPNPIMEWDAISALLMDSMLTWILAIVCVGLIGLFAFLEKKGGYPQKGMRVFRTVIYVIAGGLVLTWVLLLVGSVKGFLPQGIRALYDKIPYLQWNNLWGNGRGFTWSFTAKMLSEMNIKNRIFGVGPDCYAIYGHGNYNDLIATQWNGAILSNAHNEWLNMFVNGGLFGGVAYLGIYVSAIVRFVRKSESIPILIGFAGAVAAYVAHNIFCYQQILCTPFVFLFLALGEYQIRKKKEE